MEKLFESGTVKKQIASAIYEDVPYRIMLLDKSYLPQVMALQTTALQHLSEPELFQQQPEQFMRQQFGDEGETIGVVVKNQLVAFMVVHFPAKSPDAATASENLGIDLHLPQNELPKVAHIESSVVHSDYTGKLLMLKMGTYAFALADALKYHHFCVTTSPKNTVAVIYAFKVRMAIRALKEKYGGKLRYIFYNHLKTLTPLKFQAVMSLPISAIQPQQDALQQGLWGYTFKKTDEGLNILYGKVCEP